MVFGSEKEAKAYLQESDFTDEDMYWMAFEGWNSDNESLECSDRQEGRKVEILEREKIRIEMDVLLRDDDIDDIMISALEGGITHWCDKAEPVGEYLGTYASEQISRGGMLRLYDFESGHDLILTKKQFVEGFKRYIKASGPVGFLELVGLELRVDPGCIDSEAADAIVQYALFGDVIYG